MLLISGLLCSGSNKNFSKHLFLRATCWQTMDNHIWLNNELPFSIMVCMCVHVPLWPCVHLGWRSSVNTFSSIFFHLIIKTGSPLMLELPNLAGLAGQWVLRICWSLPSQPKITGLYQHAQLKRWLPVIQLGSSCLYSMCLTSLAISVVLGTN